MSASYFAITVQILPKAAFEQFREEPQLSTGRFEFLFEVGHTVTQSMRPRSKRLRLLMSP
ncbi:MAG: hypothetical protein FJ406_07920 [Verrucomicrobia bacterium]|nr:hypothetical protein [Verrucomicrobiota bacterium]